MQAHACDAAGVCARSSWVATSVRVLWQVASFLSARAPPSSLCPLAISQALPSLPQPRLPARDSIIDLTFFSPWPPLSSLAYHLPPPFLPFHSSPCPYCPGRKAVQPGQKGIEWQTQGPTSCGACRAPGSNWFSWRAPSSSWLWLKDRVSTALATEDEEEGTLPPALK